MKPGPLFIGLHFDFFLIIAKYFKTIINTIQKMKPVFYGLPKIHIKLQKTL